MRKLFVLGFILLSKLTFAQNKDTLGLHTPFADGKVVYQRSFTADKSKSQLHAESKAWFEQQHKGLDTLRTIESADAVLNGRGWDGLTFKGPLGMNVPSRVGYDIAIHAKNDGYTVQLSDILLAYQEQPNTVAIYFTAEDLMNHVLGKKYPKGTFDPVPFSKKRAKKVLTSLNEMVARITASANQAISSH